jgi:hypothetical protein
MNKVPQIYIGNSKSFIKEKEVIGEQVLIANETYNKISNVETMRPFFMSIVSNSNHWMFISSNGGITAGRKDSNTALFPYYTDDKITESEDVTGTKTLLRVQKEDKEYLWEPFSTKYKGVYNTSRNLYKNSYGNKVIFEEINHDLDLTFVFEWNSSNIYGFVKKTSLINNANVKTTVSVLDGLQNILPYGIGEDLQKASSNLVDAYKRSELIKDTGLGIFALSAIIVDKAEPSEALKSNVVWSLGIKKPTYLLSSLQVSNFRKGFNLTQETDVKAEKGAYFVNFKEELNPQEKKEWSLIANVNQSVTTIIQLNEKIKKEKDFSSILQQDIDKGTNHLIQLVAAADGIQLSEDTLRNSRHFSNTMFNIMRGGIFDDNYTIEKLDFVKYIANANKKVYKNHATELEKLPSTFSVNQIKTLASKNDDKNFKRLCFEYLPLKFSRRHGDPSRPWNKFSINTRSEVDGSKILDYEGNWRDIFQNWEALAHSYPEFIEGMIHKFLNATTFDGYNPYRVTKGGFDWETIEPDNPWSYIGYWGDHQIIYLLKFLEFIEKHYPNKLNEYFNQDLFVYANVPYRIKSYQDILKDPKDTIEFDHENEDKIQQKRNELGADGALLRDENYFICKVNFIEKILATVLAKMSNFIPEGGIWMNTQRPEWNDANNALVGNGVSMVTLYYLRRFFSFFEGLIKESAIEETKVSEELVDFFNNVKNTLENHAYVLSNKISDTDRKTILDGLGNAGSNFRNKVYNHGFSSNQKNISKENLLSFINISLQFIDHSIEANKRADNLYHAYNLMTVTNDKEVEISNLSEMLEGQVAVLSSGYLSAKESVDVLDALKSSKLFRAAQYSYILYPNKELPGFLDRNNIPKQEIEKSKLLQQLLSDGNTQIVEKDCLGNHHFNGDFNNVNSLKTALSNLSNSKYKILIAQESALLFEIFERIFNHKAFTGRSGTFFGYEGLGSIYWHMVSKLQLAAQEVTLNALANAEDSELIGRLYDHYFEINEGVGVNKSPKLYGGFPTDPYSHTPNTKGVQQPGMTGQVKEDILSRFGELGVCVKEGILQFNPSILRKEEFLLKPTSFTYVNVLGAFSSINLEENMLSFTYCQVPVIYKNYNKECIEVHYNNGQLKIFDSLKLDKETSKSIFERDNSINSITVSIVK